MNRPPGESAEVLLSICVITFQRIEGVTRLLSDLAGSPGIDSPQVEVLVIDNCPSEQT